MKSRLLPLLCGAAAAAGLAFWISNVSAQTPVPGAPAAEVGIPLGQRCVVTLDPAASDGETAMSELLRTSGFTALNRSEGVLVRLDADWLVLRDGNYDNWIPRSKVFLLRSAR